MLYSAKVAACSEINTKHKHDVGSMHDFRLPPRRCLTPQKSADLTVWVECSSWMLNLLVHQVTSMLKKVKKYTFFPHSVLMCFAWMFTKTAIISLYGINWLVFITETERVHYAVRTVSLNVTHANLSLQQLMRFLSNIYKLGLIIFS
jgi:hypothetical protein